jgi:hypothetical protein
MGTKELVEKLLLGPKVVRSGVVKCDDAQNQFLISESEGFRAVKASPGWKPIQFLDKIYKRTGVECDSYFVRSKLRAARIETFEYLVNGLKGFVGPISLYDSCLYKSIVELTPLLWRKSPVA